MIPKVNPSLLTPSLWLHEQYQELSITGSPTSRAASNCAVRFRGDNFMSYRPRWGGDWGGDAAALKSVTPVNFLVHQVRFGWNYFCSLLLLTLVWLDGLAFFPRKSYIPYPLGTYCFQYSAQDFKRICDKWGHIHPQGVHCNQRMMCLQ